jgi:large subunit ribosomal protein L9
MKVIISKEVKEVKNGYARNFLLPRNLAKIATAKNLKILSQQKTKEDLYEKELIETLAKTAQRLKSLTLDFYLKTGLSAQAGDNKKVFGSISASEIAKKLADTGYKNLEIILEKPIKELGEHLIEINLGKGIRVKIKIKAHSQS